MSLIARSSIRQRYRTHRSVCLGNTDTATIPFVCSTSTTGRSAGSVKHKVLTSNSRSDTSSDIHIHGQSPITASTPQTTSFKKILGAGCPHLYISPVVILLLGSHPITILVMGCFRRDGKLLAGARIEASERAHWLHDANRAVYGEDYKKQNKNISAHFLNETEPNWHLDASLLHYSADEVKNYFAEWAPEWQHLGTEPLIALWLLRTQQHAHNLSNSLKIERNYIRTEYPRLCYMRFADRDQFRYATKELMGAQLNIKM